MFQAERKSEMSQAQVDRDMEEILSSIRQIIADDVEENEKIKTPKLFLANSSQNEASENVSLEKGGDILELTNMLPEDVYKGPLEKESARQGSIQQAQIVGQKLSVAMEQSFPTRSSSLKDSEDLISQDVAHEVSKAVEGLSHLIKQPSAQNEVLGSTIENVVHESLQPLLREWLDQNLAKLVKEVVAEQIDKILKK
jgi:cell pole-organizing protein PopZ